MEVVPSDFMKLPGRVPPPKSWIDAEGKTPGCKACDSGNGKHSVAGWSHIMPLDRRELYHRQ